MVELYNHAIYGNNTIYHLFENTKLDRGALGGLYEKFVVYRMNPDE